MRIYQYYIPKSLVTLKLSLIDGNYPLFYYSEEYFVPSVSAAEWPSLAQEVDTAVAYGAWHIQHHILLTHVANTAYRYHKK